MHRLALFASLLLSFVGCTTARVETTTVTTGRPRLAIVATLTPRDFLALRWVAGTWRGTGMDGTVQAPFYERYSFTDDSTLVGLAFSDSTLSAVRDTIRFALRGGHLTAASSLTPARWAASAADSATVAFVPLAGASSGFVWHSEADGRWRATMVWPATDSSAMRRHDFLMTRIAR